jgi:hypothetical protein
MADKNYLNLLDEFGKIRDVNLAIFTTYSFDPIFFEHVILRALKRYNPDLNVVVLVDAEHYPKASDFTSLTGVNYLLIPVPGTVFHPKVFLFLSKKKGLAYIGSHNLTLSGFTHNLELSLKSNEKGVIYGCISFFLGLFSRILEQNTQLIKALTKYEDLFQLKQGESFDKFVLHSLNQPILQAALEIVKTRSRDIKSVTIYAPFYSHESELVEKIKEETGSKQIKLAIQRENHNLNVDKLTNESTVSFKELVVPQNRSAHSKFVLFEGNPPFVLIGSPNFTQPALNRTIKDGNCELALLMQFKREPNIFKEISFKDISVKEVKDTARIEIQPFFQTSKNYEVYILIASVGMYNQLDLTLDVKTDKKELTLVLEQPNKIEKRQVDVNSTIQHKSIHVAVVSPLSVYFEDCGSRVSNRIRVYNLVGASNYGLLGYRPDTKRIPAIIANAEDLESLLTIISQLFPEERHPKGEGSPHQSDPLPGRMRGSESQESIFEIILDFLRSPRVPTIPRGPSVDGRRDDAQEGKKGHVYDTKEVQSYAPVILEKWTATYGIKKLALDNSLINYSFFILISLKMIDIFSRIGAQKYKLQYYSRLKNNLVSLMEKYDVTQIGEEDFLLFISLLIYLKTVTIDPTKSPQGFEFDEEVINKIIPETGCTDIPIDQPLKGLELEEKILSKLDEVKLNIGPQGKDNLEPMLCSLIATVILNLDKQARLIISKKMINDIFTIDKHDDRGALNTANILKFIALHDLKNRENMRLDIESIMKNNSIRGFRNTLYIDILFAM